MSKLNLGTAAAGGRGANFKAACDAQDSMRVHAICERLRWPYEPEDWPHL